MDFPAYLPDLYEDDYCYYSNYDNNYDNDVDKVDTNETHTHTRRAMPACQFVLDAQFIWPAFRFPHYGQHFQPLAPPVIELAAPLEALEIVEATPPKPCKQKEKKARERDVGVWKRAQPVVDEEKRGNPANRKKTKKKQQQQQHTQQQQRGRERDRERGRYFDDESTSSESVATAPLALLLANRANNNNNKDTDGSAPLVESSYVLETSREDLDESEIDTLRDLSTHESSLSSATATATERPTAAASVSASAATEKKKPLALVEKRRGERAKDDGLVFRTIDPDTGEFMEIVYGFQNTRVVPDNIPASSKCASYAANSAEDISDVTDGD